MRVARVKKNKRIKWLVRISGMEYFAAFGGEHLDLQLEIFTWAESFSSYPRSTI